MVTDRMIQLRHATLAQIAAELADRATVVCPVCCGHGCPACRFTGREPWPELRVTAERLERLANDLPI
jgi:hypothetical protein